VSAASRIAGRTFAALVVPNYRKYFIGQVISNSGTWMQSVAQGWLILQLTGHNGFYLGVSVALQYLPMLLLGSYGGLLVDRTSKRRVLYVTQSTAGLSALVLGLLVSTHHAQVWQVFVLSLALGVSNMFDVPARQAFIQEMVGRDLITNAVSLNSALMNSGRLIGPAISAGVIAAFGTAACFFVNAGSYVAVLIALLAMDSSRLTPIRRVTRAKGQVMLGLRYVKNNPVLRRPLIAVAIVGTFAFNFTVTLPLLVQRTFHDQRAGDYGILLSAMGLGAILGGLTVAHRSRPSLKLMSVLGILFGLCMAGVALSPNQVVATILLVPTGAFSIAFVSTGNAMLQLNSTEEMRGRVMSLHATAFLGSTPVGAPIIGIICNLTNPRVGLGVGASLTFLTGLMLARQSKEVTVA
jgi:MFS family permease